MFVDWALASLHHLAVFSLAAILAAEFVLIRNAIDAATIRRLGRIDLHYGIAAGLVVVFGVARVFFGPKGYEYYVANHIFWTKILLFVLADVKISRMEPAIARQRRISAGSRRDRRRQTIPVDRGGAVSGDPGGRGGDGAGVWDGRIGRPGGDAPGAAFAPWSPTENPEPPSS